eukprot:1428909-Pyramimonas_sp.AAC.1
MRLVVPVGQDDPRVHEHVHKNGMETRMSLFSPWPRRPGRRYAAMVTMLPLLEWRTVGVKPTNGGLL